MVLSEELEKERDSLAQEVRQLKMALKAESLERDLLDENNRAQEKRIRGLEKKLADAKAELEQEAQERDKLDRLNSQNERDKRSVEIKLATLTQSNEYTLQEVSRLRDDRVKLRARLDEMGLQHDKEIAEIKDQLRQEKKSARDAVYRLEEERDDARRQLSRAQQPLKRELAKCEARAADLERQLNARTLMSQTTTSGGTADVQRAIESALKERSDALTAKAAAQTEANEAKQVAERAEEERKKIAEEFKKAESELRTLRMKVEEEKDRATAATEAAAKLDASLREAVQAKEESLRNNSEVKKLEKLLDEAQEERRSLTAAVQHLEEALAEHAQQEEKDEEQRALWEETEAELKAQIIELTEDLKATQNQLSEAIARTSEPCSTTATKESNVAQIEKDVQARLEGLFQAKLRESSEQAHRLSEELNTFRDTHAQEAAAQQKARESLEEEKRTLSFELSELRSRERDARLENEALQKQLTAQAEKLAATESQRDALSADLDRSRKEHKRRSSVTGNIEAERVRAEKELNDARQELKRLAEAAEKSEHAAKAIEARLTSERDHRVAEAREEAARQVGALEKRLDEEKAEGKRLRLEFNDLRAELSKSEEQLSASKQKTVELQSECSKLSAQIASLNATIADFEKQQSERAQRKKERKDRKEKEAKERRESEEKNEERTKEKKDKKEKKAAEAQKRAEEIEDLQKARRVLESELSEKRTELEGANKLAEQVREESSKLRAELQAAKQRSSDAEERARTASSNAADAEASLASTKAALKAAKSDVDQLRAAAEDAASSLKVAELALSKQKLEVSRLEDEVEHLKSETNAQSQDAQRRAVFAEEQETSAREELALAKKQLEVATLKSQNAEINEEKATKEATELKAELEQSRSELQKLAAAHKRELEAVKRETQQLQSQLAEAERAAAAKVAMPVIAKPIPAPAVDTTELEALKKEVERLKQENSRLAAGASAGEVSEESSTEAAEGSPAKLGVLKRAGPARRAPSAIPGARKLPGQLEGAVQLLPAGISGEALSKRLSIASTTPSKIVSKLIQLKGRRRVRSWQVEVSRSSLNSYSVFILDTSDRLFQWNGQKCNRLERSKAVDIVAKLNRTRGGRAKVVVMDEGDTEPEEAFAFWKELGGKGPIASVELDDAAIEAAQDVNNKLLHLREDGELERIEGNKLVHEMLETTDCYVLDCVNEIYAWIGKNSSAESRAAIVAKANELLESSRTTRPAFVEVVRCNQGGESVLFCEKFPSWPEEVTLGPQKFASNIAASKKQEKIDVAQLLDSEPPVKGENAAEDDTDGLIEAWRVVESEKEEVTKDRLGQFYSEHCYVVLYTSNPEGSLSDRSYTIYFWQGMDSTKNDQGTAAAIALNMSKRYRGATQIRAPQQSEPTHFLKIFKGRLLVHKGSESRALDSPRLYHVRGNEDGNSSTVEVEPTAKALNSNDAFLVASKGSLFLWKGASCNAYCALVAADISKKLETLSGASMTDVTESAEPASFWSQLGGKDTYADLTVIPANWRGRFYVFSTRTGVVTADPAWRFSITDLKSEIMVLIDAWSEVILWMGSKAKEKDKKICLETASDYAKLVEQRESRGTVQVLQIAEGKEPVNMTALFHGWRPHTVSTSAAAPAAASVSEALKEYEKKYTYAELKNKAKLPPTVDKANLERYLSDEEFQQVFGMSREKFEALPAWQKTPKKKDAGLF